MLCELAAFYSYNNIIYVPIVFCQHKKELKLVLTETETWTSILYM